jgi:F-actin capping protein alpha subunit
MPDPEDIHITVSNPKKHSRSGRWRSEYIIDLNEHKLLGRILVNVHYYEQGNVSSSYLIHAAVIRSAATGPIIYNARHLVDIAVTHYIFPNYVNIKDPRIS